MQTSVTINKRKPILGDETIVWPGTKVIIKSSLSQGIVMHSIKYGETYFVRSHEGEILQLKKSDMEIMSCE